MPVNTCFCPASPGPAAPRRYKTVSCGVAPKDVHAVHNSRRHYATTTRTERRAPNDGRTGRADGPGLARNRQGSARGPNMERDQRRIDDCGVGRVNDP